VLCGWCVCCVVDVYVGAVAFTAVVVCVVIIGGVDVGGTGGGDGVVAGYACDVGVGGGVVGVAVVVVGVVGVVVGVVVVYGVVGGVGGVGMLCWWCCRWR